MNNVIGIAGGYGHSLAVKGDGTVWAWGSNGSGQLGDGTTTGQILPEQVQGIAGAKAVAAEYYDSVAVLSDGTMMSWGDNQRLTPVHVVGISGVVSIVGGASHAIAVTQSGAVWAWGSNSYGQLGDGTTTQRPAPVELSAISGPLAIASGYDFSLAVRGDGTVVGWGDNNYGQLGNTSPASSTVPIQVPNACVFSVKANGGPGNPALSYHWQIKPAGQSTFSNLSDNATYLGSSTPSLTVQAPTAAMDGDQLQCVVSDVYGAVTSSPASIFVGTPQLTLVNGNNQATDFGQFSPQPFDVQVMNNAGTVPLVGMGVDYIVQSGGGFLAASPGVPTTARYLAVPTDSSGRARAYFQQPSVAGLTSQIGISCNAANTTVSSSSTGPDTLVSVTSLPYIGTSTQSYTVPAGANYVVIHAWGGGGGSCPDYDTMTFNPTGGIGPGGNGGCGSFVTANYNVNPGETFSVTVGGGGFGANVGDPWARPDPYSGLGGWPGGANGTSGGGGYTRVQTPYGDIWVGGGGGAANYGAGGDASNGNGGNGTCTVNSSNNPSAGSGGTLTSGGTGGNSGGFAGSQGMGGSSGWSVGGGGGGGWYGGGGGANFFVDNDPAYPNMDFGAATGGGAGSSNVTGAAYHIAMSLGSSSATTEPLYPGDNVSLGGVNGMSGGNGAVVILAYQTPGPDPVMTFRDPGTQTYTVPANTTYVTVKAWAAGGNSTTSANGGAGAYVAADYAVTPGQTISMQVGQYDSWASGRTVVTLPNGATIYAASGGNAGTAPGAFGGAGGAPNGQSGGGTAYAGGGGGATTAGSGSSTTGSGGTGGYGSYYSGYSGAASPSGAGGYDYSCGGSGFSGGGGGGSDGTHIGGGGGGSSAVVYGNQAPISSQMIGTSSSAAPDSSDTFYPGGNVGAGGVNGGQPGPGAVVIIARTYPPTITSSTSVSLLQNQASTYTISGSYGPTSFSAISLPPGLTINPTTGQITGSISAPGTYTSTIFASNRDGTGQTTLTWTIDADTTAPSVPTGLQASNLSLGSFQLSWSASTDNAAVAKYEVQVNGTSIGSTSSLAMGVTNLSPGVTYAIAVRALDGAGNASAWSTPLNLAVSSDVTPPSVVANGASVGTSTETATLVWDPSSDNVGVAGYRIYRDGSLVASTSELSFVDTGLSPGSAHSYAISAYDAAGNASATSTPITVTTSSDFTGDSDHDGVADSIEAIVFPGGHATVSFDNANALQLNFQQPTR